MELSAFVLSSIGITFNYIVTAVISTTLNSFDQFCIFLLNEPILETKKISTFTANYVIVILKKEVK